MATSRVPLAVLACLVVSTSPLPGQAVRGKVVDDQGQAVATALLLLLDSAGAQRAAALSDLAGDFSITAPAPGRYTLRIERIGHRTSYAQPLVLMHNELAERRIVAPALPIELPAITAAAKRQCTARPSDIQAVAILWLEARKGLQASQLSDASLSHDFRTRRWVRLLELPSLQVLSDSSREQLEQGQGSPFVSAPVSQLIEDGFIVATNDSTVYYGPDATVLLSDEFADAYCLTPAEEPGRVGIRFRPVVTRGPPAVTGTLWLDRATFELRQVEYRYVRTRLPADLMREVGGLVEFDRLPDGVWIVRRWRIRMPLPGKPQIELGLNRTIRRAVDRIREEGGEVLADVAVQAGTQQAVAVAPAGTRVADPDTLLVEPTSLIPLDPVVVEAKRADFEAELEAKPWRFTRSALSVIRPAEVLGAVGSALDIIRTSRAQWLVPQPGFRHLTPTIYLDDMRMTKPGAPPEEVENALRQIPAAWVGAIERIRPLEAGMIYGAIDTGAGGVILIYSRRW